MPELAGIEVLVLDVDGVLTDGRLYVDVDGRELKAFSILDGAGIKMMQLVGLRTAIISGHASDTVRHRFEKLGVSEVHVGKLPKRPVFDRMLERMGVSPAQVAVMGDDVVDLPLFAGVGFRATVPNAHPDVLHAADFVTRLSGGHGAVREVIDLILRARGRYDEAVRRWAT